MKRAIHTILAGALLAAGIHLSQGQAQAQYYNPYGGMYQAQMAGAMNPYSPFSGGNLYSPGAYGGGSPYSAGMGYGYNPLSSMLYNPYLYSTPGIGYGISLMGSASVMQSYGQVITSQENARILREQANQAKIDTRKKAFDLEMYIRANTPTYTQEEERVAKNRLRRIQTLSLPGEITNGHSLNTLLKDLGKYPGKKIAQEPLQLSESVLSRVNVTKNTFGIGLLRDGGRVTWPLAMQDLMTVAKRKELDNQLKSVVEDAFRGRLDGNALKDVTNEIKKLTEVLVGKSNEIETAQYHAAKRFLADFNNAVIGLQNGEAQLQAKFQRFVEGGKSVQEVVEYMIENGLRFAPATAEDEAAYRAVYARLARFDVAMNTALGIDNEK